MSYFTINLIKGHGKNKNIFISFIEEAILNENYTGYVGGRIEVSYPADKYPRDEIRFFTNKIKEFYNFREEWDMKEVSSKELKFIKDKVKKEFCDIG